MQDPNADLIGLTWPEKVSKELSRTYTVTRTTAWSDQYVEVEREDGHVTTRPVATVRAYKRLKG